MRAETLLGGVTATRAGIDVEEPSMIDAGHDGEGL